LPSYLRLTVASVLLAAVGFAADKEQPAAPQIPDRPEVRIARLVSGRAVMRRYGAALPSLLKHVGGKTTVNVVPEPVVLVNFEDERIFQYPFIYANFADRADWTLSALERSNLKKYLERGGFLFVDGGINAEFLREKAELGQHHSFADWDADPKLKESFSQVFPNQTFRPLKRSHSLYRSFYQGLPDPSILPDTVREFVINEKWPDGTYAMVALHVKGRIAVLASPIIAMGWGKNSLGGWRTNIRFRIREGTEGLSETLKTAAYSGARFEATREDGGKDVIYCQKQALPAWAEEPGERWRVFRYYGSRDISDFAHVFYTRLGTNILVHALTH
jgi:hypothetical protein